MWSECSKLRSLVFLVEMVYGVLDPFLLGVCTYLLAQDGLETAEERERVRLDGVPLKSQPTNVAHLPQSCHGNSRRKAGGRRESMAG